MMALTNLQHRPAAARYPAASHLNSTYPLGALELGGIRRLTPKGISGRAGRLVSCRLQLLLCFLVLHVCPQLFPVPARVWLKQSNEYRVPLSLIHKATSTNLSE